MKNDKQKGIMMHAYKGEIPEDSLVHWKADLENTYCVAPHNEVHVDNFGDYGFCCQYRKGLFGNIKDVKAKDFFWNKDSGEVRANTKQKVWPDGCGRCQKSENKSGWSHRFGSQHEWNDPANPRHHEGIHKFSIDFSNACNLRCTMCSPKRSTGWYKDINMLMDNMPIKEVDRAVAGTRMEQKQYVVPARVVDENLEVFLGCKLIECSGGEPFFQPEFWHMVDKLIEHNYQGDLKIVTNLTLLDEEKTEKLKKLNTRLVVSLDAIGDVYEYIRPAVGTIGKYKGELIQQRILDCSKIFHVGLSYTPQLLNMYNIKPYIEWLWEHEHYGKSKLNDLTGFNAALVAPIYLCLQVHPDIEYRLWLASWIEEKCFSRWNNPKDHVLRGVVHLLKKPYTAEDKDNWKFFCKTTELLDKHRKTSILKYIPQLEKYWISPE